MQHVDVRMDAPIGGLQLSFLNFYRRLDVRFVSLCAVETSSARKILIFDRLALKVVCEI